MAPWPAPVRSKRLLPGAAPW